MGPQLGLVEGTRRAELSQAQDKPEKGGEITEHDPPDVVCTGQMIAQTV